FALKTKAALDFGSPSMGWGFAAAYSFPHAKAAQNIGFFHKHHPPNHSSVLQCSFPNPLLAVIVTALFAQEEI
ncbi:hypothetical protein ACFL4I_00455, partial [Pseudomonadota bacterium]